MSFDKFLKQIGLREYTKEDREELARREAIRRQIRIERVEINQKWTFVFGDDAPKQKKNLHVLENVTPRNIWFEDLYLVSNFITSIHSFLVIFLSLELIDSSTPFL